MKKSIPCWKVDVFKEKLAFINKKLAKYGKDPLQVSEIGRHLEVVPYYESYTESHYAEEAEFIDYEVTGLDFFKKDDKEYRYIGTINYQGDTRLVNCFDDEYLEYFTKGYRHCDHCHTDRKRKRYHVFEMDGKIIQIGATCAKEYFGYDIESFLTVLPMLREENFFDGGEKPVVPKDYIIRYFEEVYYATKVVTKDFTQWLNIEESCPSSKDIACMLFTTNYDKRNREELPEGLLDKMKEYWSRQESGSFKINVLHALEHNYVSRINLGIFAYAMFKVIQEIRKEELLKSMKPFNAELYAEGEKVTLDAEVVSVKSIEVWDWSSRYKEMLYIVNFLSSNGILYVAKSTGCSLDELKKGDNVTIKGTIKGVDEYNGIKSWSLKRVKVE